MYNKVSTFTYKMNTHILTLAEDIILLSADSQRLVCMTGFWAVSEDCSASPFPHLPAPCPVSPPHVNMNTSHPSHPSIWHDTPQSSPVPQILLIYSNVLLSLPKKRPNWPEGIKEQLHCSLHSCCWSYLTQKQFHHTLHWVFTILVQIQLECQLSMQDISNCLTHDHYIMIEADNQHSDHWHFLSLTNVILIQ